MHACEPLLLSVKFDLSGTVDMSYFMLLHNELFITSVHDNGHVYIYTLLLLHP